MQLMRHAFPPQLMGATPTHFLAPARLKGATHFQRGLPSRVTGPNATTNLFQRLDLHLLWAAPAPSLIIHAYAAETFSLRSPLPAALPGLPAVAALPPTVARPGVFGLRSAQAPWHPVDALRMRRDRKEHAHKEHAKQNKHMRTTSTQRPEH